MKIKIARGKNRFEKFWKNSEIEWLDLVDELSQTTRTRETLGEFMNMKKSEQY